MYTALIGEIINMKNGMEGNSLCCIICYYMKSGLNLGGIWDPWKDSLGLLGGF